MSPSYRELAYPTRRHVLEDVDALHACAGRTAPQLGLEAGQRIAFALGQDLHRSIRPILNPARDALALCCHLREETEADTLHTTSQPESPGNEHRQSISTVRRLHCLAHRS